MINTLLDALAHHVMTKGDKVFVRHVSDDCVDELTFRRFAERVNDFARTYAEYGARRGDVILIFLPTSPDVLASFVGAMKVGAVPSLMPLPSTKQHPSVYWPSHHALLERTKPAILLTDAHHVAEMRAYGLGEGHRILTVEMLPGAGADFPFVDAAPTDVALLQHSSGTTSLKKGVMLTHAAIISQVRSYAARLGATEDDAIASWLPLYHDMGLIACSMMPLVLGQTVTILDPFTWVARPVTLFNVIERYHCHFAWLPNFAFEHLTRAVPTDYSGDLSMVRAFIDCSEPCKPETFDRFYERFAGNGFRREAMQVCYAMAETVFAVSQTRIDAIASTLTVDRDRLRNERVVSPAAGPNALRLLSNGAPIDGITVTIREGERALGEGEVGEIAITGSFLFDGYYNAPEVTAERLRDGVYFTRDLGFLLDGELYVLGRKDDLIIVNGRNLHAHEVEALAAGVPGLKPGRVVAFGAFNAGVASEELVIVAESDESGVDEERIVRAVRDLVFDETSIDVKDILIVSPNWLVKTTSGKISREKNREKYLAATAETHVTSAPPAEDVAEEIRRIIAMVFRTQLTRIKRSTVAGDVLGWDSLAHSTLILKIEQALGIRFKDDEIFSFNNVGELIDRANELLAAGPASDGSDRVILDDENVSIVRLGEARGELPDIIIFAGLAQRFGGLNVLDFASTLQDTQAQNTRKFFVTDKRSRWFTDSFDKIAATLNAASGRSKVVMGNSMGGYGALALSPLLDSVISILSFVPQPSPPANVAKQIGSEGTQLHVRPTPGVPTCIVFGEVEDESGKAWVAKVFDDPALHYSVTVPNIGHSVVPYINKRSLLKNVLLAPLDPPTMGEQIASLAASIKPSAIELKRCVQQMVPAAKQKALPYLLSRLKEEGVEIDLEDDKDVKSHEVRLSEPGDLGTLCRKAIDGAAFHLMFDAHLAPFSVAEGLLVEHSRNADGAEFVKLANGPKNALSSGTTGAFSVRLPDEFEAFASDRDIEIRIVARAAGAGSARVAVAYSTNDVGNSGWIWFSCVSSWTIGSIRWHVPRMKKGNGDFIGLRPTQGLMNGVEIACLSIQVI